jgi:hypothetical protein
LGCLQEATDPALLQLTALTGLEYLKVSSSNDSGCSFGDVLLELHTKVNAPSRGVATSSPRLGCRDR